MKPTDNRPRRGFTLIEAAIFFTIVILILGAAWSIFNSGSRLGRTAVEGITLQQGVRALVENMVRDVNGALLIQEPNAATLAQTARGPLKRLVLYSHRRVDPGKRYLRQGGAEGKVPYPFAYLGKETAYRIEVFQVVYELDEPARTVTRTLTPGDLVYTTPAPGSLESGQVAGIAEKVEFQAASGGQRRTVLAREVEYFRLYPFSYDHVRRHPQYLVPTIVLTDKLPGNGDRADQTVGVVLRVKANFRPEDEVSRGEDSSFEMVTRIWSYPKYSDHIYRPYFSSVDRDFRY